MGDDVRYGRAMLVPEWGAEAQRRLQAASIVVIGLGGLGSPVAMYLGGGGAGRLVLVDHDTVDGSNLHRQVVHTSEGAMAGVSKAESAAAFIAGLNGNVRVEAVQERLTRANARDIVRRGDVVVDASDNARTRYAVSDACAAERRPLVSAAALRGEGTLTVCGYNDGPCYRCLHPVPPADPQSCAEAGVLGPVTGALGALQALEAMKVAAGLPTALSGRMLYVDAMGSRFRVVQRPPRRADCRACGPTADYATLSDAPDVPPARVDLDPLLLVTPTQAAALLDAGAPILDVRDATQFAIGALPGSIHLPLARLSSNQLDALNLDRSRPILVVCRRGIFSAQAALVLSQLGYSPRSMIGGLQAWKDNIDQSFPGRY